MKLALLIAILSISVCRSQNESFEAMQMDGLSAVNLEVTIDSTINTVRSHKTIEDNLRATVEYDLRTAGIKIAIPGDTSQHVEGSRGTLLVEVDLLSQKNGQWWVFTLSVDLIRMVEIINSGDRHTSATVWNKSQFGICPATSLESELKEDADLAAKEFANAYLAAHQK